MQAFSADEVVDLLREKLGFREDVVQLFESNDIDCEAFLLLEDKDLEKLGVTLSGERLKLRKLIRDAIASNDERPLANMDLCGRFEHMDQCEAVDHDST